MFENDPRENRIDLNEGAVWEEDNRKETMYHWGSMVLDLCDLPVSEYMKPNAVIAITTSGGSTPTGETKTYSAYTFTKNISELSGNPLNVKTEDLLSGGTPVPRFKKGDTVSCKFVVPLTKIEGYDSLPTDEDMRRVEEENAFPFYFLTEAKPTAILDSANVSDAEQWKYEERTLPNGTTVYLYYRFEADTQSNVIDATGEGEDAPYIYSIKF